MLDSYSRGLEDGLLAASLLVKDHAISAQLRVTANALAERRVAESSPLPTRSVILDLKVVRA